MVVSVERDALFVDESRTDDAGRTPSAHSACSRGECAEDVLLVGRSFERRFEPFSEKTPLERLFYEWRGYWENLLSEMGV